MKNRYKNPEEKQYRLNWLKSHKDSVNLASKTWRRKVGREYFRNWESENPRITSHYEPDTRHAMTERLYIDDFACKWYGCKLTKEDCRIDVNHILPINEYPELEAEVSNMICYCKWHHALFHLKRGDSFWRWILGKDIEPIEVRAS